MSMKTRHDEVAAVVDMPQTQHFCPAGPPHSVGWHGPGARTSERQFLAPWDMGNVVDKARATGNQQIMVCERGVSFRIQRVSGLRGLRRDASRPAARWCSTPPIRMQQPGGLGSKSGGQREHVPVLARAAMAAGISRSLHGDASDPANALSDGPNSWPLTGYGRCWRRLSRTDQAVKRRGFIQRDL